MLSLGLVRSHITENYVFHLVGLWMEFKHSDKAMRLLNGNVSDLVPIIADVEAKHREWVAQDPKARRFGLPSYLTGG